MAAFDQAWWDARTLTFGRVQPSEHDTTGYWIRWRLIDDLLQRYYNDFGLEPSFRTLGRELYNVALASPTCQRAPRWFGRVCATAGVHPARGPMSSGFLDLDAANALHADRWPDWRTYRTAAIATLGLADAGVVGHDGCFHRRGKALTPLVYRIALLLRTEGAEALDMMQDRMVMFSTNDTGSDPNERRALTAAITACGEDPAPGGPPRFIGVDTRGGSWIALRTDGWIATRNGPFDAAARWRGGDNIETIAAAIHDLASG